MVAKESRDTFQIEVCARSYKQRKLITKLYNKFKILTGRTSYVIDPPDGKKFSKQTSTFHTFMTIYLRSTFIIIHQSNI
jgi:hypothetical protein